jgi:hypothetical protein
MVPLLIWTEPLSQREITRFPRLATMLGRIRRRVEPVFEGSDHRFFAILEGVYPVLPLTVPYGFCMDMAIRLLSGFGDSPLGPPSRMAR